MGTSSKVLQDGIVQTIRSLCDELPEHSCAIQVGRPDERTVVVTVQPANPRAARMEVRFEADFGVYLTVGTASVFEIPLEGKRYTKLGMVEELEQLAKGVVRGHLTEHLVRSGGTVIGATGEVLSEDESQPMKESWMKPGLGWFKKKERAVHRYEPYLPAQEGGGTTRH